MALWRITVKNRTSMPCKNKRQVLEKGMSVETSTISTINPLGRAVDQPMLAQLFMNKYGIEIEPRSLTSSYFTSEKLK